MWVGALWVGMARSQTPGVRPDKVAVECASCGTEIGTLTSNTMFDVPLSCPADGCCGRGTVTKNCYGYVDGTYGGVDIRCHIDGQTLEDLA